MVLSLSLCLHLSSVVAHLSATVQHTVKHDFTRQVKLLYAQICLQVNPKAIVLSIKLRKLSSRSHGQPLGA